MLSRFFACSLLCASVVLSSASGTRGRPEVLTISELAGTWNLKVHEALATGLTRSGLPRLTVRLKIATDGSFVHEVLFAATPLSNSGNVTIVGTNIKLVGSTPFPLWPDRVLNAELSPEGQLKIQGGTYQRADLIDLPGVWTLRSNGGKEDKSIKLTFTRNGQFEFSMAGAKSSGTYRMEGGQIHLTYTHVDGARVNFNMKKTLTIGEDGTSILVDRRFTYRKAS